MKILNKIFLLIGLSSVLLSCSDFLEPENIGNKDEDYYLRLYEESRGLVEHVYGTLGLGYNFTPAYLSDEAVKNSSVNSLATGGWSVTSDPFNVWDKAYDNLRNLHLYLDKVHATGIPFFPYDEGRNGPILDRYYGDVYFLKAWNEWTLLKVYGGEAKDGVVYGYPIINEMLDNEDYITQSRNTYQECVDQIMMDLDSAIKYLPYRFTGSDPDIGEVWTGKGSGQAALALKARVKLWAASAAYNKPEDAQKWNEALAAATYAVNMDGGLKSLSKYAYNNTDDPDHYWRTRSGQTSSSLEWAHYPGSLFGKGECNPSKNLFDAIPMANGYPIDDPMSGYDENNPFAGRDLRFENFFFYNNDSILRDGEPFWGDSLEIYEGGKDYWGGFRTDVGTRTGFYLKKFMNNLDLNSDKSLVEGKRNDFAVCERLGRAELYLTLAEAAVEAGFGPMDDLGYGYSAFDAIKKIRERAGIAEGTTDTYLETQALSATAFIELIKNERRVELCFQGFRFFDLRRWMEDISLINSPVSGVKVTLNEDQTFSYEEIPVVEERAYMDNTYYLPLPYNEVIKSNGALQQNTGWE